MPKRPGRFKRAMKATGRGIARGARAVVKGTKVLAKRQLTKKEIEWAHRGNIIYDIDNMGRKLVKSYRIDNNGRIVVVELKTPLKHSHTSRIALKSLYTPDGKLIQTSKAESTPLTHDYEDTEKIYEPPGSFRHREKKRIKYKR